MLSLKQITLASVLVFALVSIAAAQDSTSATIQTPPLAITAAAAGERVRITAPSSVVQIHIEVYAANGEKLFDQEIRGGNVFDWHSQNGQAERLPAGDYVCVVTAKSVSGKLTQKLGAVTVAGTSVSLKQGDSQRLSPQQAQAIGPVEDGSSWTIISDGENQTTTVIASDGTDGQMIRGRGALSFRIGDFFSGKDEEQMRLTEEGNLGIGTSEPKAKLDVAGTIRAQRFLVVKPTQPGNKAAGDKTSTSAQTTDSIDSVQPLVGGSGAKDQLPKWLDTSGNLTDSVITETAGKVGIGTTGPGNRLEVRTATVNDGALIYNTNTTTGGSTPLFLGTTNSTGNVANVSMEATSNSGATAADFIVRTGNTTANGFGAARLFIRGTDGNVGIGTTAPGNRLDVRTGTLNDGALIFNTRTTTGSSAPLFLAATNATGNVANISLEATSNAGVTPADFIVRAGNTTANGFGPTRLFIRGSDGKVGIGTPNPNSLLDVAGDINVTGNAVIVGNIAAKYQDVAEWVFARKPIAAGTLVILDSTLANAVKASGGAYDTHVAGVISLRPGVILGEAGTGKVLVATTGRVKVRVDATRNPIKIGDLLVTSDKPGVAMKSLPIMVRGVRIHRPGTIVGKALEPLARGTGEISVLLSLQ